MMASFRVFQRNLEVLGGVRQVFLVVYGLDMEELALCFLEVFFSKGKALRFWSCGDFGEVVIVILNAFHWFLRCCNAVNG